MKTPPTQPIAPLTRPFDVRLELPGSKSYANRALICAAMAGRPCVIENVSQGQDTALMLNLLGDLGWSVTRRNPLSRDVQLQPPQRRGGGVCRVFTGAAGTATRFATALLAATPGEFELDCSARMQQRPMTPLIAALRQLGAQIERDAPPLRITGGTLRGGRCVLPAGVSSQFVSAILMVAPWLGSATSIELQGPVASASYVGMTIEVLRAFGVPPGAITQSAGAIEVRPAMSQGAATYSCPPDATGAGYFWAAAAITASACVVDGLSAQSAQGDVGLVQVLERMGCAVLEPAGGLGVRGPVGSLRPVQANLSDMPDSALALAVVCAFAMGESRLDGLATLRDKETDRLAALEAELARIGVQASVRGDSLIVVGRGPGGIKPAGPVRTYDDHRVAMSFALAGLVAPGVEIENPEVVEKSFPEFWQLFARLERV